MAANKLFGQEKREGNLQILIAFLIGRKVEEYVGRYYYYSS